MRSKDKVKTGFGWSESEGKSSGKRKKKLEKG
jgi:hypothetical protein